MNQAAANPHLRIRINFDRVYFLARIPLRGEDSPCARVSLNGRGEGLDQHAAG